jgi:hypothetical protein
MRMGILSLADRRGVGVVAHPCSARGSAIRGPATQVCETGDRPSSAVWAPTCHPFRPQSSEDRAALPPTNQPARQDPIGCHPLIRITRLVGSLDRRNSTTTLGENGFGLSNAQAQARRRASSATGLWIAPTPRAQFRTAARPRRGGSHPLQPKIGAG